MRTFTKSIWRRPSCQMVRRRSEALTRLRGRGRSKPCVARAIRLASSVARSPAGIEPPTSFEPAVAGDEALDFLRRQPVAGPRPVAVIREVRLLAGLVPSAQGL